MDVHNYAYIARKAFHGFIHRLAPVVFENAFVVQGACSGGGVRGRVWVRGRAHAAARPAVPTRPESWPVNVRWW